MADIADMEENACQKMCKHCGILRKKTIRNFAKQFEYEPKIENEDRWKPLGKYIICGMGGSHLQGDVMQNAVPGIDLSVHQYDGLPHWPEEVLKQTLIIASSYSGNTEEVVSFAAKLS